MNSTQPTQLNYIIKLNPTDTKSTSSDPTHLNQTQPNSTNLNQTQPISYQFNPSQANPTQLNSPHPNSKAKLDQAQSCYRNQKQNNTNNKTKPS